MDSSMQRSDSLKSITNFANRMNPRRSLNIFKRQGSFASNRTSRQEIEEARTRYLDARGKILRDFIMQRKDSRPWTEILHDPILSANGDIKSDFALMECLHDEQEKVELKCILLILYGTSSLRLSSGAPIRPSPLDAVSKPWDTIPRPASSMGQSFAQLRTESSYALQRARQPTLDFSTHITQSEDMIVILNARATVLLNVSFRNLTQAKQIVKLSSLALTLWQSRVAETDWGYRMFDRGSEDEENAWIFQRLIVLIRDDIYQHFCSVINDLTDAEKYEQQRHIDIFVESMRTWQKMTNRHFKSMWGFEHDVECKTGYPGFMAHLRDSCEKSLEEEWGEDSTELCRSWPYSLNRIHDYGAEWVGPLSSDDNDKTPPVPISVPWLERRESGYWFRSVDEAPTPRDFGLDYEQVSGYLARSIDEAKRRRCKYRH